MRLRRAPALFQFNKKTVRAWHQNNNNNNSSSKEDIDDTAKPDAVAELVSMGTLPPTAADDDADNPMSCTSGFFTKFCYGEVPEIEWNNVFFK